MHGSKAGVESGEAGAKLIGTLFQTGTAPPQRPASRAETQTIDDFESATGPVELDDVPVDWAAVDLCEQQPREPAGVADSRAAATMT